MKVGDSTLPKVETVLQDDDNADEIEHTYFLDIPEDKTTMPDQDVIDDDGNPISGLDHIVDNYINMEVRLPFGEKELYDQVIGLCLDKDGRIIGTPHKNPFMNSVLYKIKFDDGSSQAYGANVIAKRNMGFRITFPRQQHIGCSRNKWIFLEKICQGGMINTGNTSKLLLKTIHP